MKKCLALSLSLLVSSGLFSLEGRCADGGEEVREFPSASFTRIFVDSDRGNVNVVGEADPVARVSWPRVASDGSRVDAVVEDSVLKIINKKLGSGGVGCAVDWRVKVPQNTPVQLNLGMAETGLSGLTGEVHLVVGAGKLVSNAPLTRLTVNAGNLDGDVRNLAGDSSFNLGSGKLKMTWMKIPSLPRTMTFNFGRAKALVNLPEGSTVNMDGLDTAPSFAGFIGGFTKVSALPSSSTPNFIIKGGGGSGGVEVKKISGEVEKKEY